jgi:hypothetical protein
LPNRQLQELHNLTGLPHFQLMEMGPGRKFYDVVIVKASFYLKNGVAELSDKQAGPCLVYAFLNEDEPEYSSMSAAGDTVLRKPFTDVTGEIQVNSPEMIFAKEPPSIARCILGDDVYHSISDRSGVPGGRGHELYAQWRSLDPNSAQAQTIAAESRAYYDSIRRNSRGNN